jgi:hypothetical protein
MPPVAAQASDATGAWAVVGVTIHDLESGKEPTYVITAQARDGLTLPIEAAISIPKDATLLWAGQLLGGNPADDPLLETRRESADGYDLLYVTLTRSNAAQFELAVPESMYERRESSIVFDLSWPAPGAVDRARIAVITPLNLHLEDANPTPEVSADPERGVLYAVETKPVLPGDVLTFSAELVGGPAPELEALESAEETDSTPSVIATSPATTGDGEPQTDGSGTRQVLIGVLAALLVGAVALLVWRVRASSGPGSPRG